MEKTYILFSLLLAAISCKPKSALFGRVPEIIFWHIPSTAYKRVAPMYGIHKPCVGSINRERVASQAAETGLMKLLVERPSVKVNFEADDFVDCYLRLLMRLSCMYSYTHTRENNTRNSHVHSIGANQENFPPDG